MREGVARGTRLSGSSATAYGRTQSPELGLLGRFDDRLLAGELQESRGERARAAERNPAVRAERDFLSVSELDLLAAFIGEEGAQAAVIAHLESVRREEDCAVPARGEGGGCHQCASGVSADEDDAVVGSACRGFASIGEAQHALRARTVNTAGRARYRDLS